MKEAASSLKVPKFFRDGEGVDEALRNIPIKKELHDLIRIVMQLWIDYEKIHGTVRATRGFLRKISKLSEPEHRDRHLEYA